MGVRGGIMTANVSLSGLKNRVAQYATAFLAIAVALGVGRALGAYLGAYLPYVAIAPAIAFSAWYCGLGPSALASVLTLAALKYWFLPPGHTLLIVNRDQIIGLIAFLVATILIVAMGELRRRENERLRQAQSDLEDRVRQRTAELDIANQDLRQLTARLMQLQDEERRRIARELHDSVGQMLVALSMNLTTVGSDIERLSQTARAVSDSAALVAEMNKEVRTISYLLHPPLLDEAGLPSALRWYVDGFSQRSKIEVTLDIPEDFGRLPQDLEIAIFRTVQESLTNIHRHSGSPTALVGLDRTDSVVHLTIEDNGSGIPVEKRDLVAAAGVPGVGISGMRERLRQLGGTLEIKSNTSGTRVEASLPNIVSSKAAA